MHFSRQNLQTFVISHTFLPLTVTQLSTIKYSPVFGQPCTVFEVVLHASYSCGLLLQMSHILVVCVSIGLC